VSEYPSDEEVWRWGNEFANAWLRGTTPVPGMTREQFIARKACDWQREQDAKICEQNKSPRDSERYNAASRHCADAIRASHQEKELAR
jgi:hypothetical protein